MRSTKDLRGVKVRGGKKGKSKIGKVKFAVFHPEEARLVGFVVKRPDFLLMFPRSDRFLAFDSFRIIDGRVMGYADADAWGDEACKRLGFDFDDCLVWEDMPLVTESGTELGRIDAVNYDEQTGDVLSFTVTQGAKWLVGTGEVPVDKLLRYSEGSFILKDDAADMKLEGGAAAKAGERVAETNAGLKVVGKQTAEAAKVGAEKGKAAWGGFREKYIDLTDEEAAELEGAAKKKTAPAANATDSAAAGSSPQTAPAGANSATDDQSGAEKVGKAWASFREKYIDLTDEEENELERAASQQRLEKASKHTPAGQPIEVEAVSVSNAVPAAPAAATTPPPAAPAQAAPAAAPAPAQDQSFGETATAAVAKQVEKSRGMFAAFKEEYEKAKNGED